MYKSVQVIFCFTEASGCGEADLQKLERESLYDQVKRKWAETCLSLAGGYVQATPSTSATAKQPNNQNMPSEEEGWALKKVRHAVTFSENARNYLKEVFLQGEETGHKANPADVATRMQDDSGKKRFEKTEKLTTAQISRYFSNLSTLSTVVDYFMVQRRPLLM